MFEPTFTGLKAKPWFSTGSSIQLMLISPVLVVGQNFESCRPDQKIKPCTATVQGFFLCISTVWVF